MTIQKRLFISNILMLVIPIVVAILSFSVCVFVLNAISQGQLFDALRAGDDQGFQSEAFLKTQAVIIFFIVIIAFVAILFITSRILIKSVFSKIRQPLELLSDGAREISEGNLDYRIAYAQDDEFKPVCEDFNDMAAKLKSSIEEVQKNERNRKELLASISHDLRSPLTSVKAFVEGLVDGIAATPEEQREYLEIIRQKTDDINNLVSKLFLYSKMDMGDYPVNPEDLNIGSEISDLLAACKEEYRARGLIISADYLPGELSINADPVQLRSIMVNILDNSAKYKDKEIATMVINCQKVSDVIRVTFDDNGPGVPDEALPKLFDVFYRDDPARNRTRQGSGLGLAIAEKAAQRMNGRITAENRCEGGLRIILEIPESVKGGAA